VLHAHAVLIAQLCGQRAACVNALVVWRVSTRPSSGVC
jgi:hypothetical protein